MLPLLLFSLITNPPLCVTSTTAATAAANREYTPELQAEYDAYKEVVMQGEVRTA